MSKAAKPENTDLLRRVPPQNLEGEQSVLGAILLDNKVLNKAAALLEIDDFYRETHREIYRAMTDLDESGRPIDAITLSELLKSRGALEAIGGVGYIAELAAAVPTAVNIAHYARIVREKAVLRNLATTATEIASRCFGNNAVEFDKFLLESEAMIAGICRRRSPLTEMTLPEHLRSVMLRVDRGPARQRTISTGFTNLDKLLRGGFRRGDVVVLAALPSVGKTAFAMNVATHVSRGGCLFLSVEMQAEDLVERIVADLAQVDVTAIELGEKEVWDSEVERVADLSMRVCEMNLEILKRRRLTPREARREALIAMDHWDGKLDLIVIDYLQLMKPDEKQDNRNLDIGEITGALKDLAEELDCAILLLSQLNRSGRGDSPQPTLDRLRDSGSIEQDADIVIFLWEFPLKKGEVRYPDMVRTIQVTLAKVRKGAVASMEMDYEPLYTRFKEKA